MMVAFISVASIHVTDSVACGPDFPIDLLSQRPTTMTKLPDGIFMKEVQHLVDSPARTYLVTEGVEPANGRKGGSEAERSLYDRGAAAFNKGDIPAAIQLFEELLSLPAEQRRYRSTWAAFMLGRLRHGAASIQSYQLVRTLFAAGFRDDLGLASASLRQEAARHSVSGNRSLLLARYAELASHGSQRGSLALLFFVRAEIARGSVTFLTQDPIGQKLLGAYLYTRRLEISDKEMVMVLKQLAQAETLAGAARFAAAAYREGKWNLAQRLAMQEPTDALARWVLAKLASRQGNQAEAERLMALIHTPDLCDKHSRSRVAVERVVLALKTGNALEAMTHAWNAHEHDVATYIAERVLTIEELTSFLSEVSIDSPDDKNSSLITANYHPLLARRLMRKGHRELRSGLRNMAAVRFEQAQMYFDAEHANGAKALAKWLLRAHDATDSIERADAFFRASTIARKQGLELLGTFEAPDWRYGQYDESVYRQHYAEPAKAWMGEKESRRVQASAPAYSSRYHYRRLASELAEQAANSLPTQSQAFAAALCHATRYVFNTDRARVGFLWSRYVNQGPTVDFSSTFGIQCPGPEFVAARRYLPKPKGPSWLLFSLLPLLSVLGFFLTNRFIFREPQRSRDRIGRLGVD